VGAGTIGLAHIQAAQMIEEVQLCAIVDPSPNAHLLAKKIQVPLYAKLEELIEKSRPDGVVLATPNALHVSQALACLDHGVTCLLEKPIAPSVAEALVLVKRVESVGARLLIGHHRAHSSIMQKSVEVIQSGQLGRLVGITGSATFYKPSHYFTDAPWRRQLGAGPILVNMIHEVHNLRMLCGEVESVQAYASNSVRGFEVEDTVAMTLRFESGALGTFLLSDTAACARSWEQTSEENKAYSSYSDEDCYVVCGTRGSISIPTMRVKSYPSEQESSWWKPFTSQTLHLERHDPILAQMKHFAQVVRGEVMPLVSARDGLMNLMVTEAIALAAKEERTVKIASHKI